MTAHSPSCLCCGTPISSKVFGPLPGGLAAGFAAGVGVVGFEADAGPSVKVTGLRPGRSVGGRELGRDEGAEALPDGAEGFGVGSKAGIEGELPMAGDAPGPALPPLGLGPYWRRRSS